MTQETEPEGSIFHCLVIKGELSDVMPQNKQERFLDAGSYFGSTDRVNHTIANQSKAEAILHGRTNSEIKTK